MKHSVRPERVEILEINPFNKKYVKEFSQGKNSNGHDREKKIRIDSKDVGNFVIGSFAVSQ